MLPESSNEAVNASLTIHRFAVVMPASEPRLQAMATLAQYVMDDLEAPRQPAGRSPRASQAPAAPPRRPPQIDL